MHATKCVVDICKSDKSISVPIARQLHRFLKLTLCLIKLPHLDKQLASKAEKIYRLRMRWLLNQICNSGINVVDRSIKISPLLGQVSKMDVCVGITRFLLNHSLEDLSRLTYII